MTPIDTSSEAVEQIAYVIDIEGDAGALAAAILRALAAERDELRKALEPLAARYDKRTALFGSDDSDNSGTEIMVRLVHLRAARAAHAALAAKEK